MSQDRKFIACNYAEGISEASEGALCYLISPNYGNASERVRILVRSRGGRWIAKWEATRRLTNFRVKTIPPEHPRYGDSRPADYYDETTADSLNRVADRLRRERADSD